MEAALVFPLFLLAVTAFLYLFFLLQLQTEVGRALTDTGKELSQAAYLTDTEADLLPYVLSTLRGGQNVDNYLEGRAALGIMKGGASGISMLGSRWDSESSTLILQASYQVVLPPGISWFHPVTVIQTKTVRGWTGFGGRRAASGEEGEEVVYLTEHASVYHRSLECRHLKLSIRQEGLGEMENLRNESGGKYYPCERCWKNGSSMAYITGDGSRYHESLNCPGLVRSIRTVRISETGGLPPCSVCGG